MTKDYDKTQMLLASAQELIAEIGYHNLSIRKLAHRADVSVGYLYNYFSNKKALLDALIDHFYQEHLHDRICTLDVQLPFIDYIEHLFYILKNKTMDPIIHEEILAHYYDHFKVGLSKVMSLDSSIDDTVWETLSPDDFIDHLTRHLLFEVSLPNPQYKVLKVMLMKTLTKEKTI